MLTGIAHIVLGGTIAGRTISDGGSAIIQVQVDDVVVPIQATHGLVGVCERLGIGMSVIAEVVPEHAELAELHLLRLHILSFEVTEGLGWDDIVIIDDDH